MKFEEKRQLLKAELLAPKIEDTEVAFIEASRSLNYLTNMACLLRPPKGYDQY